MTEKLLEIINKYGKTYGMREVDENGLALEVMELVIQEVKNAVKINENNEKNL